jgi:hypothetical protein
LSEGEDENEKPNSRLRYVTADFAKGMYAIVCLAFDVFVILQIYNWYSTELVAALVILLLIVISGAEVWAYRLLKKKFFDTET